MAMVWRLSFVFAAVLGVVGVAAAQAVKDVTLSPASLIGGISSAGTVDLVSAATSDVVVKLKSNAGFATVPATVTVTKGTTSATFTVSTVPVGADSAAQITASVGTSSIGGRLTVLAPRVSGLTLSLASVKGGGKSIGTVTLNGAAPAGSFVVALKSSSTSATVPASVSFAAGKTSVAFTVTSLPVAANTSATITGTTFNTTASAKLAVLAPVITAFTASPANVTGGVSLTEAVSIDGPAPAAGLSIALSTNSVSVTPPATLVVPAGAVKASVSIPTKPVAKDTPVQLGARLNGVTTTAACNVLAPTLAQVTVSQGTVIGSLSVTGTITLSGVAPTVGVKISLASNNAAATVPATVTVAAGAQTVTFTVATTLVPKATSAKITGALGSTSIAATLNIQPQAVTAITFSPTVLIGGGSATGSITINSPAVGKGFVALLSSSLASATVPASVLVPAGSTLVTFPITTQPVTQETEATIKSTDPNGALFTAPLTLLVANGLAPSAWPKGQGNARNTSQGVGPAPQGKLAYVATGSSSVSSQICLDAQGNLHFSSTMFQVSAMMPSGQPIYCTPGGVTPYHTFLLTLPDGTVFSSIAGTLLKYSPSGVQLWSAPVSSGTITKAAMGSDGTLYMGSDQGITALTADGGFKWQVIPHIGLFESSPAVGPDGNIYLGCDDKYLHAYSPAGTPLWSYLTGNKVKGGVVTAPDGTIYVGSDDGKLYAIHPDGTLKWSYQTNSYVESTPLLGSDGTIYFGSYDNAVYALNPDGTKKWSYQTAGKITTIPAIAGDGTLYVGSNDGKLYAFDTSGKVKWSFAVAGPINSSPGVGVDGTVYVGSPDDSLYALTSSGQKKWWKVLGTLSSAPAIGVDGTLYLGCTLLLDSGPQTSLMAMNPDTSTKWVYPMNIYDPVPAIAADGTIYIGTNDKDMVALNPDGTKKWSVKAGYPVYGGPVIGPDGTIYFESNPGSLYALSPTGTVKWIYGNSLQDNGYMGVDALGNIYLANGDAVSPSGHYLWSARGSENTPVIGSDGSVYRSGGTTLTAYDSQGNIRWTFPGAVNEGMPTAIGPDGTIYACGPQSFYAINPNGTVKWTYAGAIAYPLMGADGTIYGSWQDGQVLNYIALTSTGKLKWSIPFVGNEGRSPSLAGDGTIYIPTWTGMMVVK